MSNFIVPTLEEVTAQAHEIGLPDFEAKRFWLYYDSKNWFVGKNKMVRWRSALAGWKVRYEQFSGVNNRPFSGSSPSINRRNSGVAAAGSSYAELARAKLQKQNAQRQPPVERALDKKPPASGPSPSGRNQP